MNESKKIFELHKALLKSDLVCFPIVGKVNISDKQGVYIIYGLQNEVLHVGTTKRGENGLNQRLYDHLAKKSSFRNNYLKPKRISLRNGYKFRYIIEEDGRKRALLEALTTGLLCPVYIRTGEKKDAINHDKF